MEVLVYKQICGLRVHSSYLPEVPGGIVIGLLADAGVLSVPGVARSKLGWYVCRSWNVRRADGGSTEIVQVAILIDTF